MSDLCAMMAERKALPGSFLLRLRVVKMSRLMLAHKPLRLQAPGGYQGACGALSQAAIARTLTRHKRGGWLENRKRPDVQKGWSTPGRFPVFKTVFTI